MTLKATSDPAWNSRRTVFLESEWSADQKYLFLLFLTSTLCNISHVPKSIHSFLASNNGVWPQIITLKLDMRPQIYLLSTLRHKIAYAIGSEVIWQKHWHYLTFWFICFAQVADDGSEQTADPGWGRGRTGEASQYQATTGETSARESSWASFGRWPRHHERIFGHQ